MNKKIKNTSSLFLFLLILLLSVTSSVVLANNKAVVTKHLGRQIPLDLKFVNSKGEQVLLRNLINKPTVLDFAYYRCSGICTPLMIELADVINKVDSSPGKDFDVITLSIDQNETPKMAAEKKHAMLGISNKKIPDSSWTFLTGDSTNIYKLTKSAGFGFARTYGGFLHKGVIIFVDKTGKIVQYLNPGYLKQQGGFQIIPAEFEMAVEKAGEGQITATVQSVLQTCYTYIPKGKSAIILYMVLGTGLITLTTVIIIIKRFDAKSKT